MMTCGDSGNLSCKPQMSTLEERARRLQCQQETILQDVDYLASKLESLTSSWASCRIRSESDELSVRQANVLRRIDAIEDWLAEESNLENVSNRKVDGVDAMGKKTEEGQEEERRYNEARPESSAVEEMVTKVLVAGSAKGFVMRRVPGHYYDSSLEARRDMLRAQSIECLCKSIVMVNTQAGDDVVDCSNANNSKYYVVVIQYAARLNAEKVKAFLYNLNDGKISKKRFNMRLADSDVSQKLTGFGHNAVTPFGMQTRIPVILSDAITRLDPPFFWLGGGEVDLKLGLLTADFIRLVNPFVVDCTG